MSKEELDNLVRINRLKSEPDLVVSLPAC